MNRITEAVFTVLVPVILAAQNPTPLIGSLRDGFEYQGGGLLDVKR